jgi:MFS family permease
VSLALGTLLGVFFVGLFYWGSRFRRFRRTTIIAFGLAGGLGFMVALLALNHSAGWSVALQALLAVGAVVGLFVMAGATPAALGLLADFSEGFPGQRGMIMGLYSVFLAVGQILGAVLAGAAAGWRGLDGMLLASIGLLLVALIPIGQLRQTESGAGHLDDQSRAGEPVS